VPRACIRDQEPGENKSAHHYIHTVPEYRVCSRWEAQPRTGDFRLKWVAVSWQVHVYFPAPSSRHRALLSP